MTPLDELIEEIEGVFSLQAERRWDSYPDGDKDKSEVKALILEYIKNHVL